MKLWRWAWVPILMIVIGACTADPPEAEADPTLMSAVASNLLHESPRLSFLPPLGTDETEGIFDPDLPVDVKIFAFNSDQSEVVGAPLGPDFSTSDGSIIVYEHQFQADWPVPSTALLPHEYVRVEVRYEAFLLDASAPVCNYGPGGACLGYIDVRLVPNAGAGKRGTPSGFIPVVRDRTLPITFFISEIDGEVPEDIAALRRINNNQPFDEGSGAGDNCTEFDIRDQGFQAVGAGFQAVGAGFQAVGAVGGLFKAPVGNFGEAVMEDVAGQLRAVLGASDALDLVSKLHEPAALLIVDDFGTPGTFTLPEDLLTNPSPDVTHGAVVLHHVISLLDLALGALLVDSEESLPESAEGLVVTRGTTIGASTLYSVIDADDDDAVATPLILVKAVNTQGGDTDAIKEAIDGSIPVALDAGSWYPHVVVNMSFAVVPCAASNDAEVIGDVLQDLTGDEVVTFDDYIVALSLVNGVKAAEQADLTAFVTSALDDDALLEYLSCPLAGPPFDDCEDGTHTQSVVKVASSGNFGYDFPFYPAALDSVISVSSQDATATGYTSTRSSFSNRGEVMTPGAVFVAAEMEIAGVDTAVTYSGTSFSAPNVSVFTALDLALGATFRHCEPGVVDGTPGPGPDLAFAATHPGAALDVPLGGSFGSPGAVIEYCDGPNPPEEE